MTQTFFAPATKQGSGRPFRHLKQTVLNPVKADKYQDEIANKYKGEISIWGTVRGNKYHWEHIRAGDFILFYTGGTSAHYEYAAEVLGTDINMDLARELWPDYHTDTQGKYDTGGDPWKYIIFVDDPVEISICKSEMAGILDQKNGKTQKFQRKSDKRQKMIRKLFGDIEGMVEQNRV